MNSSSWSTRMLLTQGEAEKTDSAGGERFLASSSPTMTKESWSFWGTSTPSWDTACTHNGQELADLAETFNLWIPSTFSHIHKGEPGTWIHPGTKDEIRLDYYLLDSRFPLQQVGTWVDHGIETTQQGEDHRALAMQLTFLQKKPTGKPRYRQIDEIAIRDPDNAEEVAALIRSVPQPCWETNAHDHYADWAQTLCNSLAERFTQKRAKPRKHYISATTWAIRASKIQLRKQLSYSRKHFPEHCPALKEQLQLVAKQLKGALAADRKCHLESMLADIDKVPHSQLFAQLRRLGIGAKYRRAGPRALPMMKGPDGCYANDQTESQEIWRLHASALEAGIATEQQDLLSRCHTRQQQQLQAMQAPSVLNIPSLLQIEKACRRVKPFKARGPDGLPASLYHCFPQIMAKSLRPLLCKVACQMQEPLGFKGGRLIHLFKGKGEACLPQNRRGILIANHASKVVHGSLRPNYMPALECAMLPMQLGGRPRRAVQQSAHILRLFTAACKKAGRSCGVIFLDIKTAYYQVVRETVARASTTATFVPSIISAFRLPAACEEELNGLLHGQTAASKIGLSQYLEMLLAELHTNTWFTTDQVDVLTETRLGTRPGSCFADVFFNFLFAKVLDEVTQIAVEHGLLTTLEWSGKRGLAQQSENQATATVGETIWADDLALFLQHDRPEELIANLQTVCGVLFDRCLAHGLQPNFSKGKTEVLVSLRGKRAVQLRRKWFTENGSQLPIPNCQIQDCQVRMIAKYRHLGGQVDAKATSKSEVTARLGQVRSVFRMYKKSLFTTSVVSLQQRSALLRPFVLSILDYNLGTLVDLADSEVQAITTTILHIYRAVIKPSVTKDELFTISWPWLCHALQLPHPRAVIHLARLRYFGQIVRTAPDELWAMIETQGSWLQDCRNSMDWLYENISGSSNLPPPSEWEQWHQLICKAPRQWHGLLQRAWKHDMLQDYNSHIVDKGYTAFSDALSLAGYHFPPSLERSTPEPTTHICLKCQKGFGSRTAWASHAFKKHNRVHSARKFVTGTQCGACCKEFWEYRRLFHHLRYSAKCRQALACAEAEVELEPGLNSRAEKKYATEPLKPWHRAEGPPLQVRNPWAGIQTPWDEQLFDELMVRIPLTEQDRSTPIDDLVDQARRIIVETTAEYSVVLLTIRCWIDSLRDIMADSSVDRADLLRSFLVVLCQTDVHSWLFPSVGHVDGPTLAASLWRRALLPQRMGRANGSKASLHGDACCPSVQWSKKGGWLTGLPRRSTPTSWSLCSCVERWHNLRSRRGLLKVVCESKMAWPSGMWLHPGGLRGPSMRNVQRGSCKCSWGSTDTSHSFSCSAVTVGFRPLDHQGDQASDRWKSPGTICHSMHGLSGLCWPLWMPGASCGARQWGSSVHLEAGHVTATVPTSSHEQDPSPTRSLRSLLTKAHRLVGGGSSKSKEVTGQTCHTDVCQRNQHRLGRDRAPLQDGSLEGIPWFALPWPHSNVQWLAWRSRFFGSCHNPSSGTAWGGCPYAGGFCAISWPMRGALRSRFQRGGLRHVNQLGAL